MVYKLPKFFSKFKKTASNWKRKIVEKNRERVLSKKVKKCLAEFKSFAFDREKSSEVGEEYFEHLLQMYKDNVFSKQELVEIETGRFLHSGLGLIDAEKKAVEKVNELLKK